VRLAVEGKPIQLYGDGRQLRDLTYVDDVVDAFLRVGANDHANGAVFNLGGDAPISLLDLATLIIEIAGRGSVELIPWPEARKKIDIGDVYSSHARISAVLGWRPTTPLKVGLTQTIDYYTRYFDKYVTP